MRFNFAINNIIGVENFMAAMLGVHLAEAKHFAVGKRSVQFFADLDEVIYFFDTQGQPLFFTVRFNIGDFPNGLLSVMDGEQILRQSIINMLEHFIVGAMGRRHCKKFFDPINAIDAHGLGDLHCVGAPRGDHFLSGADKKTREAIFRMKRGTSEEPGEFLDSLVIKRFVGANGINHAASGPKEYDHVSGCELKSKGKLGNGIESNT